MESAEVPLGDPVDGAGSVAIGTDDGCVDGDQGGAGIGQAQGDPFDQGVVAGPDPAAINPVAGCG